MGDVLNPNVQKTKRQNLYSSFTLSVTKNFTNKTEVIPEVMQEWYAPNNKKSYFGHTFPIYEYLLYKHYYTSRLIIIHLTL